MSNSETIPRHPLFDWIPNKVKPNQVNNMVSSKKTKDLVCFALSDVIHLLKQYFSSSTPPFCHLDLIFLLPPVLFIAINVIQELLNIWIIRIFAFDNFQR